MSFIETLIALTLGGGLAAIMVNIITKHMSPPKIIPQLYVEYNSTETVPLEPSRPGVKHWPSWTQIAQKKDVFTFSELDPLTKKKVETYGISNTAIYNTLESLEHSDPIQIKESIEDSVRTQLHDTIQTVKAPDIPYTATATLRTPHSTYLLSKKTSLHLHRLISVAINETPPNQLKTLRVTIGDQHSFSLLAFTCRYNYAEGIKTLIDSGYDIHTDPGYLYTDPLTNTTITVDAFFISLIHRYTPCFEALKNANWKNTPHGGYKFYKHGKLSFHRKYIEAIIALNMDVSLLEQYGVEPNEPSTLTWDRDGNCSKIESPSLVASRTDNINALKKLHELGHNVNDPHGFQSTFCSGLVRNYRSPLSFATSKETTQFLIDVGGDIHRDDHYVTTYKQQILHQESLLYRKADAKTSGAFRALLENGYDPKTDTGEQSFMFDGTLRYRKSTLYKLTENNQTDLIEDLFKLGITMETERPSRLYCPLSSSFINVTPWGPLTARIHTRMILKKATDHTQSQYRRALDTIS